MALDTRSRGKWWSRLHFLVRFAGLSGVVLAALVALLAWIDGILTWDAIQLTWDELRPVFHGESMRQNPPTVVGQLGQEYSPTVVGLLLGGLAAGLFTLFLEILMVVRVVAGRRSAFGLNVAVQLGLAAALFIGVNVFSFQHHERFDWTRDAEFTLSPKVEHDMRRLTDEQGKTTIVVYLRHKAFGRFSDKTDAYEAAAEEKVVEKVNDLVDEFRSLGPQFSVVVLDEREKEVDRTRKAHAGESSKRYRSAPKGYAEKLKELPEELQKAVDGAAENSIFFHARGQVQRMSFNSFYRLDKVASEENGNLVLDYQGVGPFARNVLTIEQRRPRVAVVVPHEAFGTQGAIDELTLAGLRKALEAQGFDVRDIQFRQGLDRRAPLSHIVALSDERKQEDVQRRLRILNLKIEHLERVQANWVRAAAGMTAAFAPAGNLTPAELIAATGPFSRAVSPGRLLLNDPPLQVIRDGRPLQLAPAPPFVTKTVPVLTELLIDLRDDRSRARDEKAALNPERIAEYKHLSGDLRAKLDVTLADCDLLIVPRLTLRDLSRGDSFSNRFYRIDETQAAAIQDYLAAGKPVLALFGPANEDPEQPGGFAELGPNDADPLEQLLAELGLRFSKQTVLFKDEAKSISKQRGSPFTQSGAAETPPVRFRWEEMEANRHKGPVNPVRQSMYLTSRGIGSPTLDLSIRHPRPIRYQADKGRLYGPVAAMLLSGPDTGAPSGLLLAGIFAGSSKVAWPEGEGEFILTDPRGWNENQPFPTDEGEPQFRPPEEGDPSIGTPDEPRRGQFPIAVAVEAPVPFRWAVGRGEQPKVRVAAIGSGGVFNGPDLTPAKEKLLLDTCNWLLGRDDALPRQAETTTWQYPRVEMTTREHHIWLLVALLGLPGLCAYLGVIVLLVRWLR